PRWWHIALATLVMGCSLLFYIRPVLIPFYLIAFRLLCLGDVRSLRDAGTRIRTELPFWAAITQPVVIYLTYYLTSIYPENTAVPQRFPDGISDKLEFFLTAWFKGFWPGWAGKQVVDETSGVELAFAIAIGQLALLALVAMTVVRRRRRAETFGPWLFFAG